MAAEPLWQRMEAGSASFGARLTAPRRRPSGVAAAWLGGIVALVGFGLLGGGAPPEEVTRVAAMASSPDALGARPSSGPDRPLAALTIAARAPFAFRQGEGGPRVTVEGRMLVRAERVRIAIEGSEGRALRSVIRWTADPHGGIRPREAVRFSAEFEVASGWVDDLWVSVTAFDEHGRRIGRQREQVQLGAGSR